MLKVIIADDHSPIRAQLRKMLEKSGDIQVTAEAKDGQEVIDILQTCTADVLILDVEMPRMTGLDVLAYLKESENPIRVLVVSSYSDREFIDGALSMGARGYLIKDDSPYFLLQAVHSVAALTEEIFLSRTALAAFGA